MIKRIRELILQFLAINKSSINDSVKNESDERLIQRLEKENEILRFELAHYQKLPEHKKVDPELKPVRRYMGWAEQKARLEQADLIIKKNREKEKEA